MNVWADILLGGITIGSLYVLVGHGFNLVYLTTRTFNFAQGQFVAAAGLFAYALLGAGYPTITLIVIIPAIGLVGVIEEKLAVTPILKRGDSEVWLVSTLGVSVLIQGLLAAFFGVDPLSVKLPFAEDIIEILGTRQTVGDYAVILTAIGLTLLLTAITRFTWLGRALRATAEDPTAARVLGLNTAALVTGSFLVAAAIGAIGGIIAAPVTFARADLGASLLVQTFIVLAIGGFGSTTGLFVVGIFLGMFEAVVRYIFGGEYVSILVFALLLVALIIRPRGFFVGKAPRVV